MHLSRTGRYIFIGVQLFLVLTLMSCNVQSSNSSNNTSQQASKEILGASSSNNSDHKVLISDISSWNHPVKDVFNNYNIKICKIELLNNKKFPVFYIEFDPVYKLESQNAKYFDVLLKKVASANGYWNFKVIDEKNKIVFNVECDKGKKSVTGIICNGKKDLLKEMLDYNIEILSNEYKVIEYLTKTVPEITQLKEKISKDSDGTVKLIFRMDGVPDKYSDSQYKDFYCIYVGENHLDNTVRWNSFYVDKELNRIMVEGFAGELITLAQWRGKTNKTDKTVGKNNKINENDARKIINSYIVRGIIRLTQPDSHCQVQNFGTNNRDNVTYYVIRIAYIDPNNNANTETLERYWVSDTGEEVFREDLWTGNLSKVSNNTLVSLSLDSWVGVYLFSEFAPPDENMFYEISIYKEKSEYFADISIDGFQTFERLQAKVSGDKNSIRLLFCKYLPDNVFEPYVEGDTLLSFDKKNSNIYTTWGKIQPMLKSNIQSDKVYFKIKSETGLYDG
jgi:hypothetical protein